ncbi:hypothetical protein ABZZ17_18175 [Streptomyces sp. NPDC006512]
MSAPRANPGTGNEDPAVRDRSGHGSGRTVRTGPPVTATPSAHPTAPSRS